MVAKLKLKGIDGRAPPGVKALLLKVVVPLGAGIKRLLVHSQQASLTERGSRTVCWAIPSNCGELLKL